MSLPDLADACRTSGLIVVELPGSQGRGRPGTFNPRGLQVHHTGSASESRDYAEFMAWVGRSDLPAPLAQLGLSGASVVYVLATGRANHAGTARAHGSLPAGDGNDLRAGVECFNTGTEGWDAPGVDASGNPITQREGLVRLAAALCLHYGWSPDDVPGHFETSVTGKWDPGDPDGVDYRGARVMDMPALRNDIRALVEVLTMDPTEIFETEIRERDEDTERTAAKAGVLIAETHNRAGDARRIAQETRAEVRALATLVRELAAKVDALGGQA